VASYLNSKTMTEASGTGTAKQPERPMGDPGNVRVKILLALEDPAHLAFLEEALAPLGQEIVIAQTGFEAVQEVAQEGFAAVLLGANLADMDGFEAAALLRRQEYSCGIPIFLVSLDENGDHKALGYEAGAVDYISGAMAPEILRSKLAVFVDLKRKNLALEAKTLALQRQLKERTRSEQDMRKLNSELELRMKERTAELSRINDELRQFAYVASHDLQEPLRTIGSYVQLVAKRYKGKLDGDADDFISYIVEGVKRMHALLNDMLAYSRVTESGARPFQSRSFETILHTVMLNLAAAIAESHAIITHDPLPEVTGDDMQLTQVVQNLIGNAIKYRGERTPEIHVSAERDGDYWKFAVRDNGIGIESRYLERIFGIFKRLHGHEVPGNGMGLAICRRAIERHGGQIWAESTLGEGSVFFFTLPA
jgi:signal transduction histidine kinase